MAKKKTAKKRAKKGTSKPRGGPDANQVAKSMVDAIATRTEADWKLPR